MNPDGGPAIPVSVNTDRAIQGGTAIPVYGYASAPTDGRPAQAGAAMPVRVLTAADLVQNGGTWVLEGRYAAMPVYTAPSSSGVMGGPAIAVYPINAWPPSSAVPAWAPTDLAGLRLWLKSDAGLFQDAAKTIPAVADADPVGAWADQSGIGNDATQAAAGARPTLKLNIKNGRAVVRGDGLGDFLGAAIATGAATSIFIVARKLTAPGGGSMALFGLAGNAAWYTNSISGPGYLWWATQALGIQDIGGTPVNWNIIDLIIASAASATPYLNGAAGAAFDPDNTYQSATFKVLADGNGATPGDYDVGEVLIYNSALSAANRALVETYLNTRWAVY